MPSKKLTAALNDLFNGELRAQHAYLQAAAWAAERKLDGCYKFLLHHAAEELEHMHRFFGFLNDLGASVTFTELPAPKIAVNDVTGLFKQAAAQEAKVTEATRRGRRMTMPWRRSCNGSSMSSMRKTRSAAMFSTVSR
jgi:ferritin